MIRRCFIGTTLAGLAVLLALPVVSLGQEGLVGQVVDNVGSIAKTALGGTSGSGSAGTAGPRGATPTSPGGYQPPLHGTNPHGQGTVGVVDLAPSATRPLGGDPSGAQDQSQDTEEVVVGRSRGEQKQDGSYHGHITIAAVSLLGGELVGVDTNEGQEAAGPLDALQTQVLDQICDGSGDQICLTVLAADSKTTGNGSQNHFAVADAKLGGTDGITAKAAESDGNIGDDGNCQSSHGDSTVANANVGGDVLATVGQSSQDAKSCSDGSRSGSASSQVINLGGSGVPIPAAGCADGTADTVTGIPTLLPIVCNADDQNGQGESLVQAAERYGVREALTVFALTSGDTALGKVTLASSEAVAKAPPGNKGGDNGDNGGDNGDNGGNEGEKNASGDQGGTQGESGAGGAGKPECSDGVDNDGDGKIDFGSDPDCASAADDSESGAGKPQCSDGVDNDGDGKIDFPKDPQCESAADNSESNGALALTGVNLLVIMLLGALTLAGGLRLREAVGRPGA